MTSTSLIIPVEILTLTDASLPEKMFLALCAAPPETGRWPLLTTLGMQKPGLMKLRQRLTQKGLLQRGRNRDMIQVPGLVFVKSPGGGYFVPEKQAGEDIHSVAPTEPAPPVSTPAATCLTIPAAILNLKPVLASEKILLALYAAEPKATNGQVLDRLGISLAGLKKLKRSLLQPGLLSQDDAGYRIHVPGLVYIDAAAEGGYYLSESEAIKTGKILAPLVLAPVLQPLNVYRDWQRKVHEWVASGRTLPHILYAFTVDTKKCLLAESPAYLPERALVLNELTVHENAFYAMEYVYAHLPKRSRDTYYKTICAAAPEQLAAFREQVEGLQLAGASPQKMISLFTTAINLTGNAQPPAPLTFKGAGA